MKNKFGFAALLGLTVVTHACKTRSTDSEAQGIFGGNSPQQKAEKSFHKCKFRDSDMSEKEVALKNATLKEGDPMSQIPMSAISAMEYYVNNSYFAEDKFFEKDVPTYKEKELNIAIHAFRDIAKKGIFEMKKYSADPDQNLSKVNAAMYDIIMADESLGKILTPLETYEGDDPRNPPIGKRNGDVDNLNQLVFRAVADRNCLCPVMCED